MVESPSSSKSLTFHSLLDVTGMNLLMGLLNQLGGMLAAICLTFFNALFWPGVGLTVTWNDHPPDGLFSREFSLGEGAIEPCL